VKCTVENCKSYSLHDRDKCFLHCGDADIVAQRAAARQLAGKMRHMTPAKRRKLKRQMAEEKQQAIMEYPAQAETQAQLTDKQRASNTILDDLELSAAKRDRARAEYTAKGAARDCELEALGWSLKHALIDGFRTVPCGKVTCWCGHHSSPDQCSAECSKTHGLPKTSDPAVLLELPTDASTTRIIPTKRMYNEQ
jgi:hypothetical protein